MPKEVRKLENNSDKNSNKNVCILHLMNKSQMRVVQRNKRKQH